MSSSDQRKALLNYLKSIPAALNSNIPLPSFLTTPIKIPGFSTGKPAPRRTPAGAKTAERRFQIEGTIGAGQSSRFAIDGTDFEIDGNTWMIGDLEFGAKARVKGASLAGKKVATQIIILKQADLRN